MVSRALWQAGDVMELDPGDLARFDLVMVGYVLQMVPDPVGALRAVRSVCRGHAIVLDTVSAPLSSCPRRSLNSTRAAVTRSGSCSTAPGWRGP
jgi:ubiquinone/menaquinone biosynthesis C-methylase UbiE